MLVKPDAPAPKTIDVTVWRRAIPQFNIHHLDDVQVGADLALLHAAPVAAVFSSCCLSCNWVQRCHFIEIPLIAPACGRDHVASQIHCHMVIMGNETSLPHDVMMNDAALLWKSKQPSNQLLNAYRN